MSPDDATTELTAQPAAQPVANPFGGVSGQTFIDSLPSAAVVVDENLRIVAVNRRAAEFIGYNPAHSVGRTLEGIFRTIFDRFQRQPAGESDPLFEHHFNGSWYAVGAFPIASPHGAVLRCITATDISSRKATELEVRESEAQLEEATRIAQLGTFKFLWDGTRIDWSPYMYVLHDVSSDTYDPAIKSYLDFVHPEDRDYALRSQNGYDRWQSHQRRGIPGAPA